MYFHLYNSTGPVMDEEGRELEVSAARATAVQEIRSLLAEEARGGRIDLRGRLDVADERGEIVASVTFAEAVEVVPESAS